MPARQTRVATVRTISDNRDAGSHKDRAALSLAPAAVSANSRSPLPPSSKTSRNPHSVTSGYSQCRRHSMWPGWPPGKRFTATTAGTPIARKFSPSRSRFSTPQDVINPFRARLGRQAGVPSANPSTNRMEATLAVPWAILANGPVCMTAGVTSADCTRFGDSAAASSSRRRRWIRHDRSAPLLFSRSVSKPQAIPEVCPQATQPAFWVRPGNHDRTDPLTPAIPVSRGLAHRALPAGWLSKSYGAQFLPSGPAVIRDQ